MANALQIVVCAGIVPDPLQTLEPTTGPAGPALKNEMVLPAVLDPWASCALYEAARLAAGTPGSVTPEDERAVTYADIGRLIAFSDQLRLDVDYLLDPIKEIVLLAHEDLHSVAAGYVPDGVLGDPSWRARMTRFHGLDAVLGDA